MGILDDNDPTIVHRLILPDGQVFVDEHAKEPPREQLAPRDYLIALANGYRAVRDAAGVPAVVEDENVCKQPEQLAVRDQYLTQERARNARATAMVDQVAKMPPVLTGNASSMCSCIACMESYRTVRTTAMANVDRAARMLPVLPSYPHVQDDRDVAARDRYLAARQLFAPQPWQQQPDGLRYGAYDNPIMLSWIECQKRFSGLGVIDIDRPFSVNDGNWYKLLLPVARCDCTGDHIAGCPLYPKY